MQFNKQYKEQIANILYSNDIYNQMYFNFTNHGDTYFEELRSYLLDELLLPKNKKKYNKLIQMYQENKLKYYILNMIKISLNYPTSPFYKQYILNQRKYVEFDHSNDELVEDTFDNYNQNDENNIYYKIIDNLKLNYIEYEIVKAYFWEEKTSYRKLAKEFDVSYSFIYLIIKNVKEKIRKEYESSTQN